MEKPIIMIEAKYLTIKNEIIEAERRMMIYPNEHDGNLIDYLKNDLKQFETALNILKSNMLSD